MKDGLRKSNIAQGDFRLGRGGKFLVESGADVSLHDYKGRDAKSLAIEMGRTEIANLIPSAYTRHSAFSWPMTLEGRFWVVRSHRDHTEITQTNYKPLVGR